MSTFKALWAGFKSIRLPLLAFLASCCLFFVILFPLNDLGELVTSKIYTATNRNLFFQFDDLNLSLFPPGLQMNQVYIETSQLSPLKASELTLRPSISGLINGKPFGFVDAKGFLKGDVTLNVHSGAASEKGIERAQLELSAEKVSLRELRNFLGLPFMIQGDLKVQSNVLADLTLQEQPEADLNVLVSKFELPPFTMEIPGMGPLTLPDLKLKQIEIRTRLVNGALVIEKGEIGKLGDELFATIKGQIQMTLQRMPSGQTLPIFGGYSLDVEMKAQKSFQDKANLFLAFIQQTQKAPGHYHFKVSSPAWGPPARFDKMQ